MLTAKVMLLGDMGVGKTSIMYRLVYDRFEGNYKSTLGVEISTHDVWPDADDVADPVRCIIWDADGDFGRLIFDTVYVSGAHGAIIMSDVTRPQTITRMLELAHNFEARFPGRPYRALVNKIDLVEAAEATSRRTQLGRLDVEFVSAKTGVGVAKSIAALAGAIRRRQA
jgi:Ras-related protein Rab-5C